MGRRIAAADLVPILEPEIDILAADKAECEQILLDEIGGHLLTDGIGGPVMFKLTIPEVDGFYTPLIEHPDVVRVVALSGGYSRDEATTPACPQPGPDRELLPRAHRGASGGHDGRGVRQGARRIDRRDLRCVHDVGLAVSDPGAITEPKSSPPGPPPVPLRNQRVVRCVAAADRTCGTTADHITEGLETRPAGLRAPTAAPSGQRKPA